MMIAAAFAFLRSARVSQILLPSTTTSSPRSTYPQKMLNGAKATIIGFFGSIASTIQASPQRMSLTPQSATANAHSPARVADIAVARDQDEDEAEDFAQSSSASTGVKASQDTEGGDSKRPRMDSTSPAISSTFGSGGDILAHSQTRSTTTTLLSTDEVATTFLSAASSSPSVFPNRPVERFSLASAPRSPGGGG